jgi:hypothetical protein
VILTLAFYVPSLGYPFFWDDPVDLGRARDSSIFSLLTLSGGYLYYRPATFLLWKAIQALLGSFGSLPFHTLQVALHCTNVTLVYVLAARLFNHRSAFQPAFVAALFALLPFSHQAVVWVTSPHPLVTIFLLGGLVLYFDGRTQGRCSLVALSVIILILALPFHENAIVFGLFLGGLELYLLSSRQVARPSLAPGLPLLAGAVFAAVWLNIPKESTSVGVRFDPQAGLALAKGIAYPVVRLAAAISPAVRSGDWLAVAIVIAVAVVGLGAAYVIGRRVELFALGTCWFVIAIVPVWALRGGDYVISGSRLLYIASIGAALVWGGLTALAAKSIRMAGLIAVIATLLYSGWFLVQRNRLYDVAMSYFWQVIRAGASGEQVLFLDAAENIRPRTVEFPLDDLWVVMAPDHVPISSFTSLETGVAAETWSLGMTQWIAAEQQRSAYVIRFVV